MKNHSLVLGLLFFFLFSSCTGNKERLARIQFLESEVEHLQQNNNSLLDRLSDLAVITKTDAESIRTSIESMNEQQQNISELNDRIHQKDSINFVLVQNLKQSLVDIADEDVEIQVKGSAVYISLSEQLLFKTASAKVNQSAYTVLEKVARIINDQTDIAVLVEGHTDDVPISNRYFKDNWSLSAYRAISVVRILQADFDVHPKRLTAAGCSEFVPLNDNITEQDRADNRRTEIILTPQLGEFFEMLDTPAFAES